MTYLALDQGGHASRALVFGTDGAIIARASVPIRTHRSAQGHVEHDGEELIRSLGQAVAAACNGLPDGLVPLAAGLATQRSSMACWRRGSGAPLAPVISWQDRRNGSWLRQLEPKAAEIRARTGLVLTPHYGASKMRWCLDHLPAVAAARETGDLVMGPLASYLLHRLLVERPLVADPANAARTQLWDVGTRDWSPELAGLFGLGVDFLPRCVTSRHAYGTLPTPRGPVPLTVCTGDQSAVPFAFGPLDPATAYLNTGTGAFVQRGIRDRLPDEPRLLVSVVWSDGETVDYLLEGTVNGAGSALDWLATTLGRPVEPLLAELDRMPPETLNPPLFQNGVAGLGSPWWLPDFPTRFLGPGSPVEQAAAVLESIAFLVQENLTALAPWGPSLDRILLTGGFAANAYFCRCLITLAGIPVVRGTETEATARGLACLVAGDAARAWPAALEPLAGAPVPGLGNRQQRWRQAMAGA